MDFYMDDQYNFTAGTFNKPNQVIAESKPENPHKMANISDAPVFYPTEEEFKHPIDFFHKIYAEAEKFGICKVVPPKDWRPPFSITPETLRFKPRIQTLHLLEAKQRMTVTFYNKFLSFWSMFKVRVEFPICIQGLNVDLSDLYYFTFEELHSANGDIAQITMAGWKNIATNMRFNAFNDQLANKLQFLYQTLIAPMDHFIRLVAFEVQRAEKLLAKECRGTPKKRRMMAGSGPRRSTTKKTMKASSGMLKKIDPIAQAEIFEKMNIGKVVNNVCKKCRCNTTLDKNSFTISCTACGRYFHDKCMEQCPIVGNLDLISKHDDIFQCKSCVAASLHKDPLLNFGFPDAPAKFDLVSFGDFADAFKKKHFGVESPTDVNERVVEQEFWDNVMNPLSRLTVLYGADLHTGDTGSGFPVAGKKRKAQFENEQDFYEAQKYEEDGWNLNNFPHLSSSLLRHIGDNVSGMTRPWIYIGMCFAAFCWHTEDHWTPSINYLHFGEPKSWYGVSGKHASDFDKQMEKYVPTLFKLQPDVLQQLNTLIHPNELVSAGVPVCRTDQRAGEFVITFPRAYHCGFNQGFNCAEAVNFATSRWLKQGFDSINHYVSLKRNNVFSHEELLCKLAECADTLELEEAQEAYVEFCLLLSEEKEIYSDLIRLGIKSRKRVKLEDCENDDERSCFFCSKTLFFSAFSCSCRSMLLPKMRQSCRSHFKLLCRCAISKRQFMYRFTIREMEGYVSSIFDRIRDLKSMEVDDLSN